MKNFFALLLLAVSVSILVWVAVIGVADGPQGENNIANRDFLGYWTAGQLLVRGSDPYNAAVILDLYKSMGVRQQTPFVIRNPPSALALTLPLGLLSLPVAAVVWSLLLVACIMLSIRLLWILNGRPNDRLHLMAYVFAPSIACIIAGQISSVILLGVTLFLYLRNKHPFRAGMSLALCAIKPHLLLPFGLVLLLWAVRYRAHRLLAGALLGFVIALAIPLAFVPTLWSDYIHMARGAGFKSEFIPTFGALFRIVIDRNAAWLQLVPAAVGIIWSLWYFYKHQADWDWQTHGMLLLLVSVLVAPYSWLTDEIILLPAILHGAYLANQRSLTAFALLNGIAVLGVMIGVPLPTGAYIWTTAAWLIWYMTLGASRRVMTTLPDSNVAVLL